MSIFHLQNLKKFIVPLVYAFALWIYTSVTGNQTLPSNPVAIGLAISIITTATACLWIESKPNANKADKCTAWAMATILPILHALAGYLYTELDLHSSAISMALNAITALLCCSWAFLLPASWKTEQQTYTNYVNNIALFALIAGALASVFVVALFGLEELVGWLLEVNIPRLIYICVTRAYCFICPLLVFIMLKPQEQLLSSAPVNRLYKIFAYFFLGITLCYILICYIYSAKILFTWTLPKGGVGYLSAALVLAVIGLIWVLYSMREHRWLDVLCRYLPIVTLPLLVLMSVAVIRRLVDYGPTPSRLYLLLLNVWGYVAAIVLFITKSKRLRWIIPSLLLGFTLSSITPLNPSTISMKWQAKELKRMLVMKRPASSFPISSKEYFEILDACCDEDDKQIRELFDFLDKSYKDEIVSFDWDETGCNN